MEREFRSGNNSNGLMSPDFHHSDIDKNQQESLRHRNAPVNGSSFKKKVVIKDQKRDNDIELSENIYVHDNSNSNFNQKIDTRTYEVSDGKRHEFDGAPQRRHPSHRDQNGSKRTPYVNDSTAGFGGNYSRPVEESMRMPGRSNSHSKRGDYYYSGNKRDVQYLSDTKELKRAPYNQSKTESPYGENPRSSTKMSAYGVDADSFRDKNVINYSKEMMVPKKSDVSAYEIASRLLNSRIIEKLNNNQTGQENLNEMRSDTLENRTDVTSADFNNTTKRDDDELEREYEKLGENQ